MFKNIQMKSGWFSARLYWKTCTALVSVTLLCAGPPAADAAAVGPSGAMAARSIALLNMSAATATTVPIQINEISVQGTEIKGQNTEGKAPAPIQPAPAYAPFAVLGQGFVAEVEPNDTSAQATPLGSSSAVARGSVFPNGDIDWYSFTAAAGDRVYAAVMTSFSASASTDSQLRIFAADGTTLIEFDEDDGSLGTLSSTIAGATLPSAGTYFVQVKHFSATSTLRPYQLHFRLQSGAPTPEVEPNDSAGTANPLPAGGWVSGRRDPAAATEQDWYSFDLNAGDTVFLSLDLDPERDNVQWNGRLGLGLFGDGDNQILVVDDGSAGSVANPLSEALFMTVKTAGTYYAFVDSATAATGGPTATYTLSVSVHPAVDEGVNCTTYTSTDVPKTIGPGAGLVSSIITVPGNPRIADIDVAINLNHALMADIDANLRSPAGNDNALFNDIGASSTGGQTMMDIILDDEAAAPFVFSVVRPLVLTPELNYRLDWFDGEDAGGVWTLDLRDDLTNASGGTLNSWSLRICEAPPPPSCPLGSSLTTVYSTDFEADNGGFTHSGTADEWEYGTPATLATTSANPVAAIIGCSSGSNCWKTDLDNTYDVSSNQDLLSPNIDLTGLSPPIVVNWSQRYQMESATFDHASVNLQEVGGANPVRLFDWTGATMTVGVGSPTTNIGESSGWSRMTARADSLAGLNTELRFHLDSDSSVNFAGLAIDDVSVTGCLASPPADLAISKTDGVTSATPGGSVTYTIVASNAGPGDAPGSTVADTFPASLTCSWTCAGAGGGTCSAAGSGNINDVVNLPSGGSAAYTASCSISAAATGSLVNTATVTPAASVTDPTPGNNSATDTDTLNPSADLAISKTDGVTSATPGGSVTYTIVASNAGPSNAPGSTVTDTFPASLTCTWTCAGAAGGTCAAAGSGNINDVINLPSGGSATYTANCSISAAASGTLSNTATVAAAAGVTDPTPGNNSATDTDTLTVIADLSISKTDGQSSVVAGTSTTYTIVSSNAGPQAIVGAIVADTFPAALTCIWTCAGTGGGTCTAAGSGNISDVVNLPSAASVTHTANCAVAAATPNGTVISNTATVAVPAGASDPSPGNNSATDTTTVIAGAGVSGTKTVSGSTIPGGAITYTIVLTNAGPGNQTDNPGDEFVDVLPAQVTFNSVTASSGTAAESGGVVSWNGAIAASASVTISINATVKASAFGQIDNQGTIHYDSSGDASNDASALTDSPAAPGPADPTSFFIAQSIPALGPIALLLLALGMIAIWYRRERAVRR